MVYYVEGYFVQNFGDDLFLKVLLQEAPNLSYRIEVPKSYVKFYKSSFGIEVRPRGWSHYIKSYVTHKITVPLARLMHFGSSGFILLGGSMFIERSSSRPMINLRMFLSRMSLKKYVIGSNFGSFESHEFVNRYAQYFSDFDRVTWRDEASYSLFTNSKIKDELLPDVVLALDIDEIEKTRENYVVVNVMDLSRFDDVTVQRYTSFIVTQIKTLRDKGHEVHIVSINREEGDETVAQELKSHFFSMDNFVSVITYSDINSMIEEFAHAKQILATRFHAMIMGWIFKKPTFVISYDIKTVNFINTWNNKQTVESVYSDLNTNPIFVTIEADVLNKLSVDAKNHFSALKMSKS